MTPSVRAKFHAVALLLRDRAQRNELAERATAVMQQAQGASDTILREIGQLLGAPDAHA